MQNATRPGLLLAVRSGKKQHLCAAHFLQTDADGLHSLFREAADGNLFLFKSSVVKNSIVDRKMNMRNNVIGGEKQACDSSEAVLEERIPMFL